MKQTTEKNDTSVELLPCDEGKDQLKGHLSGSAFEEAPDTAGRRARLAATPTRLHLTTFMNK